MTSGSVSNSWTYDPRGRVTSATVNAGTAYTTQWTYNAADLPVTMTYPDGEVVTNVYNSQMLLKSVTGTNTYVSYTSYDAASRVISRVLGNAKIQSFSYYGWAATALVNGVQVGQGGRLKNITVNSLQNTTYTYDKVGNINTIQNSLASETQTFGYDALNRLTSASATGTYAYNETYGYDSVNGNLTTKGSLTLQYTDNAHKHAVTIAGSNTYAYVQTGNLKKRTVGSQITAFAYDAENRLIKVCSDSNNNAACDTGETILASFTYDGDGKQVKAVVGSTTTYYVGSHFQTDNGVVTKYYLAGAQRIAVRANGTLYFLLADHLGSTSITTDASGNKLAELRYTPWGETRFSSGTTPTNYKYTGQREEASFGWYFYNARWYDPYITQFSQPDSIIPDPYNPQDWNRYAYARNNPLVYTDPTGHDPVLGFIGGFLKELARTNLWWHPGAQRDLAIHNNESTAELTGRLVADVASMAIGVTEAGGGAGVAGGGVVACGTGVGCLVTPEALVAGGALIAQGAGTTLSAANGAGKTLSMLSNTTTNSGDAQENFANQNLLEQHFNKHSNEFGYKTIDEYLDGARGLIHNDDALTFTRSNGDKLFYDPSTNEFAVIAKDGTIRTYFKPKEGIEYWRIQTKGK